MATHLGQVTQVIDGDTFWVRIGAKQYKIRKDSTRFRYQVLGSRKLGCLRYFV